MNSALFGDNAALHVTQRTKTLTGTQKEEECQGVKLKKKRKKDNYHGKDCNLRLLFILPK